jgi:hypothetical protein
MSRKAQVRFQEDVEVKLLRITQLESIESIESIESTLARASLLSTDASIPLEPFMKLFDTFCGRKR